MQQKFNTTKLWHESDLADVEYEISMCIRGYTYHVYQQVHLWGAAVKETLLALEK